MIASIQNGPVANSIVRLRVLNSTGAGTTAGYVAVGNFFTVAVNATGTYSIDLIYDEHIIWTSPSVVVT